MLANVKYKSRMTKSRLETTLIGGGRGARVENDIEKALLNAAGKDFCQRLSEKLAVLEKTFF